MTSYTTHVEFIERELHTLVIDTPFYDWDGVWDFLRDHDAILEDPETRQFRWNPESVYVQATGVLYNLLDSYALDTVVTEKRYVAGEIWTRRTTFNAVTGRTRRVTYVTDIHTVVGVYAPDGTCYAAADTHDGKHLLDSGADAVWTEAETAWHRA